MEGSGDQVTEVHSTAYVANYDAVCSHKPGEIATVLLSDILFRVPS